MAKYIITASAVFVDGKKHRRGEIVEIANPEAHGTNIELMPEAPKKAAPKKAEAKPKAPRKPRAKKAAE